MIVWVCIATLRLSDHGDGAAARVDARRVINRHHYWSASMCRLRRRVSALVVKATPDGDGGGFGRLWWSCNELIVMTTRIGLEF